MPFIHVCSPDIGIGPSIRVDASVVQFYHGCNGVKRVTAKEIYELLNVRPSISSQIGEFMFGFFLSNYQINL